MNLIQFRSLVGTDTYIEMSKIAGVREKSDAETYIFVQCGNECEDWVVGENIKQVLDKLQKNQNL